MAGPEGFPLHDETEENTLKGGKGSTSLEGDSGTDNLEDQYQRLLASSSEQVNSFGEGTDFRALALEEQEELKSKLGIDKTGVMEISEYQRQDLADEFTEDIRALNVLERDYASFEGHAEFLDLLNSNTVSERAKEALYDIVINNSEELKVFIDLDMMGEMFPDAESVQDFLTLGSVADYVDKDEMQEIMGLDIASLSLQDLQYVDAKIQALFDGGISIGTKLAQALGPKQQEVKGQIFALNSGRLNLKTVKNIKLDEDRLEVDEDRLEVEEDRLEVDEDRLEVEEDRLEVDEDRLEVEEDRLEVEEDRLEELLHLKSLIANQLSMFEQYDFDLGDLRGLLENALGENASEVDMKQSQEAIKKFLKKPGQAKSLLEQATGKSPDVLRQTQQFLGALAEGDPEFQNQLRQIELELGLHNIGGSEIREAQSMAYFGEQADITDIVIDGETYRLGDMEIDASTRPPKSFMVAPDGKYRLEVGLPDLPTSKESLQARREFAQKKLEIQDQYPEKLEGYKQAQIGLNRLEQLESVGENELSTEQLEEKRNLENKKVEFESTVEEFKNFIRSAQKLSSDFEKYLSTLEFNQDEINEKKEQARETLKFLYEIGFTEIPQYITDQVIQQINRNPKAYGFDIEINFAEGELGMDKIHHEGSLLLVNKKAFAQVINKMIGVDAIDVMALGSTNAPVGDRSNFQTQLRESGLLDVGGIGVAMENLRKKDEDEATPNPHAQ